MTRNRKKLKTITNANVTTAAANLPASQRGLTNGAASRLDLQRLARAAAAPAPQDHEADAGQDHHGDRDEDARAAPTAVAPARGGGDRQHRLVGDLAAERIAVGLRTHALDVRD